MSYRMAPGVDVVEARSGTALIAWSPLRLVTVNAALARLLRSGGEIVPGSAAAARAVDALRRRGMVVRDPGPAPATGALPSVTIVVPVMDRAAELRRCLQSLRALRYPKDRLEIVVVDDGSRDGGAAVARAMGARVVESGGRGLGPAAARNRGAAVARGDVLAFLDSDCTASAGWLEELVGALDEPGVAAVGGRVDGMRTAAALDRYEAEMSSLSLGARGRCEQGGSDTFYLPSCNLLVRRAAFVESGGFREDLHVAEDVDLSWRLRDGGRAIAYVPRGRVQHDHRNRLWPFLRRRFEYGTSEGVLAVLHPARRKRMVLPPVLVAAALLAATALLSRWWPPAALGAAAVLVDAAALWARLRRQVQGLPLGPVLRARLRALRGLSYLVSFHLVRYHAPALLVASVAWPRFAPIAAAIALWPARVDHRVKRPALGFPAFAALYLAEHAAYGAGVLRGCLRARTLRVYLPVVVREGP